MHRLVLLLVAAALSVARVCAQPDGAVKWAFTTLSSSTPGAILSSPALAPDGSIVFGVQVGTTGADAGGRLIALTPAGDVKWTVTLPDWVDATPGIGVDGTVYAACWDGKLRAFTANGAPKWEYETGGYIASSPAIAGDGTIYVGSGDYNLHAVNLDGSRKWLYPTGDWVDGSPAVGADGTIYFGAGITFYAVGPDGTGRWQAGLRGGVVGTPAIAEDGTIYIGARDRRLYAFAPNGVLRWFFETGDAIDASPVLGADGTIYVGSLDGRFYAIAPDGMERWRFPAASQPPLGPIYSTAAVRADDAVVFGTGDDAVIALDVSGALRWRTPIGDWADSSPVIASDGTCYIGCYDKKLYALSGVAGPAASAWPMLKRDAARTTWQARGLKGEGSGAIANASIRSRLTADSPPLTVGFSVDGAGERTLLIRGVGPTLAQFGVGDALDDPWLRVVQLRDGGALAENGGWTGAPNALAIAQHGAAAGAFPLGVSSRDAAVLHDFASGGFTAEIASSSRAPGVVLAEIYDAGGESARLINVAARTRTEAADGVLTAGFVVTGGSRTLLIRGVGSGLARFRVAQALSDSVLKLFAGGPDPVAENDNWGSAPNATAAAAAMQSVGAFALEPGSRDSALLVLVSPGAYTVQLSGSDGGAGEALIEVYELR